MKERIQVRLMAALKRSALLLLSLRAARKCLAHVHAFAPCLPSSGAAAIESLK